MNNLHILAIIIVSAFALSTAVFFVLRAKSATPQPDLFLRNPVEEWERKILREAAAYHESYAQSLRTPWPNDRISPDAFKRANLHAMWAESLRRIADHE